MSKEILLKNAERASETLKRYKKFPEGVRYFHLRPTAGGLTLVTTHKDRAMRGIARIAPPRCIEMLDMAKNSVNDVSDDWLGIHYETKQGNKRMFSERQKQSLEAKKEKEFAIQAWLINEIVNGNPELFKKFNVHKLHFIGSEIIWQEKTVQGGQRIDIVAHDGNGKVLFLELKDESNTKDDGGKQVSEYLRSYGEDEDFKEFLKL